MLCHFENIYCVYLKSSNQKLYCENSTSGLFNPRLAAANPMTQSQSRSPNWGKCQVHIWTPLSLNLVFILNNPWWAQKPSNRTPLRFWSGWPLLPNTPLQVSLSLLMWALKSPSEMMESPEGTLSSTPTMDSKKDGYFELLFSAISI